MQPRPEAVTAAPCGDTYGRSPPVFTSQPLKSKTAPRTGEGLLRRGIVRGQEDMVRAELLDALNALLTTSSFEIGPSYLMNRPASALASTTRAATPVSLSTHTGEMPSAAACKICRFGDTPGGVHRLRRC